MDLFILVHAVYADRLLSSERSTTWTTPDFGGHFIACTNAACQCCVGLRYASKEDPRPLLAEQWNRKPTPSSLVDDEDERGFTPSDYAYTAELLRSSNEKIVRATASNNYNIILAALDLCASGRNLLLDAAKEALIQAEGCFHNHYPGDDPSQAPEPG